MNNWCVCWFLHIFLLGILIFEGLTARRFYKSFGVKGLSHQLYYIPIILTVLYVGKLQFNFS
jgi:hypothetical protein